MKLFKIFVSCLFYLSIQFGNAIYCFADDKEVRIGVLAFRPIEISKQQWQPTADYLNSKLPEYHFTITPLNYTDLDLAINRRQFDFVLTNPEHYITIREDHGINAIATLMPSIGGRPITTFGGVMFTRSDRADINELDDIKGKVVASPTKQSVGGYSMQIWALLKQGLQKDQIKQFRFTGMPHDNVVQEVIEGKADIGFVRTGVIEGMVRDGKIRLDQIKVLNRQPPEKFPLLLSTDLYPEWPLAAELDVPQSLIKRVAIALFNIQPNDQAAQVGQYYGFSSTGDYSSIESLMKRISENPERAHEFELRDIVRKYSIQLQVASLLVILVILATAIHLFRINKKVIKISKEREQLTEKLGEVNSELEAANQNLERTVEVRTLQLRVSEERYRRIVDTAREGIWELGSDTLTTFVNPRMAEMLGYSEKEMIGQPASDFIFDEDIIDYQKKMDNSRQGLPENHEQRFRRKNGVTVWTLASATPIFDDEHRFMGSIAMLTDITKRKQAEDALLLSSERLQLATRVANIGIWDWDIVKNELVWDDSMYQLYDIRKGDFGGAYDAWIRTIHPDDKAHTDGEIQAALRGEREYAPEFRIVRTDDTIRYIKADSWTIRDPEGKPLRMIGTNIDITDRKQVEVKIRTLNQELEQRVAERTAQLESTNKELEAFSYSVSHDLRSPLRAIDGFCHILLDDYTDKLDDEGKRLLNVVRDNTGRMGQLIDDILNFSRTGRTEMTYSEIDMEKLALEVFEELRPTDSKLRVVIEAIPRTKGDHAMMRQVFVNLVSNAIKFTRNRENAMIRVGSSIKGDEAVYYVQDNGAGFDMQYADKLFGVFQRLHAVNEFEGTGIGLAIVKRIITRHGGRVWAEGKVNEGATIYFALPIKEIGT
jgi:PAS domain S-box-containing protein